jgi:hypothetical protein
MYKLCISTYSDNFGSDFSELFVLLCQSSKLCCSDKSKVSRVEKEYSPFFGRFLIGETDFAEVALCRIKYLKLELRNLLANLQCTTIIRHDIPPWII